MGTITKKKPEDATIEEIIFDMSSCEDIESLLLVGPAGFNLEDGFIVMEYDGAKETEGYTLKEAFISFFRTSRKGQTFETDLLDWS